MFERTFHKADRRGRVGSGPQLLGSARLWRWLLSVPHVPSIDQISGRRPATRVPATPIPDRDGAVFDTPAHRRNGGGHRGSLVTSRRPRPAVRIVVSGGRIA
jgi:hypothetical protein